MIRRKTISIAVGAAIVGLLLFLVNQWTPDTSLWCHNPLAVPVVVKYSRNKQISVQPWAFVRIDLPRGTHHLEVFPASGTARLDSAEITLPATQESEVIYSIQGVGTYVIGEALEDGKGFRSTILSGQQILLPGKTGAPLLPGKQAINHQERWFEFAPTQRLVLAEEAAGQADWNGMLHHAQAARRTFAPSGNDPFLSYAQALESRALANLGRREEAIQTARLLATATPLNTEGATLAQNLLLNFLPPRVVEKDYQELVEKAPSGINRCLLGRIEPDLEKARELLLEAGLDPASAHLASEFLLQRCLWEGDTISIQELTAKLISGSTDEEDDFLRTTYATSQLLSNASPENTWREMENLLPRMDEPLTLVPWLVAAAARVGEVSAAMEKLVRVDWGQVGGINLKPPTLLYWRVQVLLEQKKKEEARKLVEQIPRMENVWDLVADLDTALACLPPNKALKIYEDHLKEHQSQLDPYRLAGYRLARECGLDETGREFLFPFSRKEMGTPERVLWEILEGEGWPPERIYGFMVQHSPQETNDISYALALRAQLDGDSKGAIEFLDHCIGYPPVLEFPSVLARRERDLAR